MLLAGKLFSKSNKQPKDPLPDLQLHLANQQDHVFKPNDIVSGHIALSAPTPISPQAIEVSFWGESRTWIRIDTSSKDKMSSYDHYRDVAPFFTVVFNLLEKPQTLAPGQAYNFPFEFRFPEGTGNTRADTYKQADDVRWTVFPHVLPPTFFFGDEYRGERRPDLATIDYGVTARLICPGVGEGKDLEPLSSTAPIIFQPSNPHAHVAGPLSVIRTPKSFTLQSSALTGQDPHSLSFRQKVSDRFSSQTPKLDFEVALEIPDLLTSGSEFRFGTSFTALKRHGDVSKIPVVCFRILKLELLDFTFFRGTRDWKCHDDMMGTYYDRGWGIPSRHTPGNKRYVGPEEEDRYAEKKTVLNALPEAQVLDLISDEPSLRDIAGHSKGDVKGDSKGDLKGELKSEVEERQVGYGECWFAARVPGHTPPSFKSFAVTRCYRVKVKLGIEMGGKKFESVVESHVREVGSA